VREIVETPQVVSQIYKKIVPLLSDYIVFNSENTLRWIAPSTNKLNQVVWNGIEISKVPVDNPYNNTVAGLPIVLLVGRINDWKGQDLLLEASLDCFKSGHFFNLVFLGSAPPGQEHLVEDLKSKINHSEYAKYMQVVDFVSDATPYYQHSDIVVVPSKRPEPFGRVAIEGMACAKPIIAARHGGLVEIVEDNVTGLLFAPNSKSELTKCLLQLTNDLDRRTRLGILGLDRQMKHFSLQAYQAKMLKIFEQFM
jgi:glycosyltransferase involved in cell wall biosynthesis